MHGAALCTYDCIALSFSNYAMMISTYIASLPEVCTFAQTYCHIGWHNLLRTVSCVQALQHGPVISPAAHLIWSRVI